MTFNAAATAPAVEALIERLAYANVSGTPAAIRTLVLDLEDAADTNLSARAAPSFLGFEPILSRSIVLGGGNLKPALADLDGDGDVDIVVGDGSGTLTVFRNVGRFNETPQASSPFNGIDVGHRSAPAFGDFDGDGDLDLAVGNNLGKVYAWRNDGGTFTVLEPADNPFDSVNVASDATPAFLDLDGDLDLVSGEGTGTLLSWRNEGASFTPILGTNPFGGIDSGLASAPAFVDLDGDGDLDLVMGDDYGGVVAWRIDTPGTTITVTVTAELERLRLVGGPSNDSLLGGEGNDTLDGGPGADTLVGGAGNDVYVVDDAGDVVVEAAAGGIDRVDAAITYLLGANVEQLLLTGTADLNGTGNALANTLTGNAGSNVLDGDAGNDSQGGGAGADTLTGGLGHDTLNGGAG